MQCRSCFVSPALMVGGWRAESRQAYQRNFVLARQSTAPSTCSTARCGALDGVLESRLTGHCGIARQRCLRDFHSASFTAWLPASPTLRASLAHGGLQGSASHGIPPWAASNGHRVHLPPGQPLRSAARLMGASPVTTPNGAGKFTWTGGAVLESNPRTAAKNGWTGGRMDRTSIRGRPIHGCE